MDIDGYPTEEELSIIEKWNFSTETFEADMVHFIEYIKERWKYAEVGYFKYEGQKLELHTGGWSGNEDMIDAIQKNTMFWVFTWQQSKRGGHYYFKIPRINDKASKEEE